MKHPRCSRAIPLALLMLAGCVSYGGPPEMISLGTQTFDASRDRAVIELGGGLTEAVALRPVDADAHCLRASAQLSNGDMWDMFIGDRGNVGQGETRWIAVPRPWQNPLLRVNEVQVVCYSAGGSGPVTMEVLASELAPATGVSRLAAARN
ncbi:MAG TPA: hypothetical protein VIB38_15465 [Aestuariivirgaceae bacterium]|jgi:hypothetical protein